MNFRRNDLQVYIESELGCNNIANWTSYKPSLENWQLTVRNKTNIDNHINSDLVSYYIKAVQSFVYALSDISNKRYSWALIKIYYAIFYALRCDILISNHFIVRCKALYYIKSQVGNSPIKVTGNERGDHQLTIKLCSQLKRSGANADPLFDNNIDGKSVYEWLLGHRERVNYKMKDFADPEIDDILIKIDHYFTNNNLMSLFNSYKNDPVYAFCFDKEHAALAVCFRKILSINKEITNRGIFDKSDKYKLLSILPILRGLGISNSDIIKILR